MSDLTMNLTLTIDVCTDPFFSYCPPLDYNVSCQLPPQEPYIDIAYVGEFCNFDENCVSSICVDHVCEGLDFGTVCSNDFQCEVGLYCDGTCRSLKGVLGSCTRDEQCKNNLACVNGFCDYYFSVAAYENVPVCKDQINYQCTSGGCYEESGEFLCLPFVKSPVLPYQCVITVDNQCTVILTDAPEGKNSSYNTRCICSQNGFATSTCALAPDDEDFVSYTYYLRKWLKSSGISKCHTTQRFSLNCAKQNWDKKNWITLAYFQKYALNYPLYVNSDSCVQHVFQKEFRDIEAAYLALGKKDDESSSFAMRVGFTLGLMFILIN
jgi:hypothetical protein